MFRQQIFLPAICEAPQSVSFLIARRRGRLTEKGCRANRSPGSELSEQNTGTSAEDCRLAQRSVRLETD